MSSSKDDVMRIILEKLDKMDSKIDKLDERLDDAEKVAIKQELNLKEHMKRSDLLEQSQDDLRDTVKPILKIYTVAWGICKIVLAISVVVGIAVGISKLMGL